MEATDFNPDFSFDFGNEKKEAAWELKGALKFVDRSKENGKTVDERIQRRLEKQQGKKRKKQQLADTDDEPLPGELDGEGSEDSGDDLVDASDSESDPQSDSEPESGAELDTVGDESDEDGGENAGGATEKTANGHGLDSESDPDTDGEGIDADLADRKNVNPELRNKEGGSNPDGNGDDVTDEESDDQVSDVDDKSHLEQDTTNPAEPRPAKRQRKGQESDTKKAPTLKQNEQFFDSAPKGTRYHAYSFTDLNLSRPLAKACEALGYERPTPIQAACIPLALAGRDICGSAVTGSGKTAAFSLPFLERLLYRPKRVAATYVLILTPTRELAVQVHSMIQKLAQFTDIRVALVVGGLSLQMQASTLKSSPEIVVGTPGRLIDHLRNSQSFGLEDLHGLVLDEADKLLQMGFTDEVKEVVRMAPKHRQTMLFSATMTEEVRKLAAVSLVKPVRLAADPSGKVPKHLVQEVVRLKGKDVSRKEAVLLALCSRTFNNGKVIVFLRTKQQAHKVKLLFGLAKLPATGELHGNMTQAARLESLEKFRNGEYAFLLATDVAGRGLDILGVEVVINFDAPRTLDTYLHRIGRTARAGASGQAVTLVTDVDRKLINEVVKKTKSKLKNRIIPSKVIDHYQRSIEAVENDIQIVLQQEKQERSMRLAEIEATRAQNMLEHETEILSRPQRTWFQSKKEKERVVKLARAEAAGMLSDRDLEVLQMGLTSGQNKGKKEKPEKGKKQKKEPAQLKETKHMEGGIAAIRKRERELLNQGMNPKEAEKMAAALSKPSTKKKKKQKKTETGGDGAQQTEENADGLFSGDGRADVAQANSRVYPGGAKSGKVMREQGKSKHELNKVKRRGKGKHAFKGKKRYKRR